MSRRTAVGKKAINEPKKMKKVGIISTYNIPCGIAEHTKYFVEQLQTPRVVLAENHPAPVYPDDSGVARCWTRDFNNYQPLLNNIIRHGVNIVDIQFEFSLYHNTDNLLNFLHQLKIRNVKTVITFHTVVSFMADCVNTLGDTCDGVIATSQTMLHPEWIRPSVKKKMRFIPLAVPVPPDQERYALRQKHGLVSGSVVATFGFLVWHKGIIQVVEQVCEIKKRVPDIKLLIIGCHEGHPHGTYYGQIVETVNRLGLQNNVVFYDKFYPINELFELLHLSDLIVMNYHVAHQTSSGAAKIAMASRRPVLGSNSMMFNDIPGDAMERTSMGDSSELGRHMESILGDIGKRAALENRGYQFAQSISASTIAHLHDEYYGQIRGY